jgi:hypothetical protein
MTERRLKRFLIPIEDVEALLKGGSVTGRPLPADAAIRLARFRPEFGELEAVYSAGFPESPRNWDDIPITLNIPIVEAK